MDIIKAKKQINKIYLLDSIGGLMIAGASWVALLAARGFTTVEIGFLESIFHIASFTFEIPSGAVADVFGRKKVMIMSSVMTIVSAVMMIAFNSFWGIAVAMVFSALSYNLASGSREALAYDSLKQAGIEADYNKFASTDIIIYQFTSSVGTLMAGIALMLGYKKAYVIDIVMATGAVLLAFTLKEIETELNQKASVIGRFKEVAKESARFIKENRKARLIIMFNACLGAVAVLIIFFLQAKLPEMGLKKIWLGPALFAIGLGSVVGAKAVEHFHNKRYRKIGLISFLGVVLAFASVFTNNMYLMMAGGFIGGFSDSFIEVRSDVVLNDMIQSDQRATLMSINAFAYSVFMIMLSPIFGWIFSRV